MVYLWVIWKETRFTSNNPWFIFGKKPDYLFQNKIKKVFVSNEEISIVMPNNLFNFCTVLD
jgi:hypothetical protein